MSKAKQSERDQAKRLNEGRCPIHGGGMAQVDFWYVDENDQRFTLVGCSRHDCGVVAKAFSCDGPWELFEESDRKKWIDAAEYDAAQSFLAKRGLVAVPAKQDE